ncbi:thyrotroph embryonic factor [Parasteatoda tepidariorum]|uniref:thyrotroph embryonic factor n=1 Tax=Parasteatoda tepidariorum TaxID=114398 RepID=UPI00077FC1EA|nr:thyrotroph embryonic factor [Parasteatoda tepidariorum]
MEYDMNVSRMTLQNYLQECRDISNPLQVVQLGKDDKDCLDIIPDASAAFLGPNLWDESKVDYIDLDSFLEPCSDDRPIYQNNLQQNLKDHMTPNMTLPTPDSSHQGSTTSATMKTSSLQSMQDFSDEEASSSVEVKFSPSDLALATPPGHKHYDPTSAVFPEDDLKPQPIVKKSRKNFVPDNLKDEKYWARRHKNNIAAKRSREARRVKENQIVLRASYLEKENTSLKEDVMRLKAENDMLKNKLKKFQS